MNNKSAFACDIKQIENYVRDLTAINKKDNFLRLKLLKEIENAVLDNPSFDDTECISVLEIVHKPLLFVLKDSSEKCKEISLKVLNLMFDRAYPIEVFFPIVVATLVPFLGISDERESSEEIRLLELQLLSVLLQKYDGNLLKYFDDITHILSKCIIDDCPEVKRKGCECASLFASKQKTNFHMVSGSLIKPLLQTISHQHFKTRVVCIRAIGSVIQNGNNEDVGNVVTHLAQRLFDHSPAVRLAVTETVGEWLVSLDDRYSYFQRLIPLILSALYDDVLQVQCAAKDLWCKAGQQYLEENEKDYKDLIDFPKPDPGDFPNSGKRPILGCRILVQRHLYNIIPPLLNDISHWVPETRVKSVKVLYSLLLHAEEKATIKLPSIIEGIVFCAKDEEQEVVSEAISCAELLGYFMEIKLLCDNILSLLHVSATAVHLSIFAAIIRGHKKSLPQDCFTAACKVLSDSSICRLRKAEEQANLLLCVDALFLSSDKIDFDTSSQLFTILVSVSGLTTNFSVSEKSMEQLDSLASCQACSLGALYKNHSLTLLQELVLNSDIWTFHNSEMPVFSFLLQSEFMSDDEINIMVPVLISNLKPTKEAKLRSHFLTTICQVVKKFSPERCEKLSTNIFNLVRDGLIPNLTWSAGKTAGALRTIAAASLFEVINKNCLSRNKIGAIAKELLPVLATLSDDDILSNRLFSCKIMDCILPILPDFVDEHQIHTVCHEFLKCMDDESDEIRIATSKLFKTYFKSFPKNYNWSSYNAYVKQLYKNLLVHMDDKNENIRIVVLDMLKEAADVAPEMLIEEVNSSKYMMSAGDLCEELINHTKNLKLISS